MARRIDTLEGMARRIDTLEGMARRIDTLEGMARQIDTLDGMARRGRRAPQAEGKPRLLRMFHFTKRNPQSAFG